METSHSHQQPPRFYRLPWFYPPPSPPSMAEQITRRLANHALDEMGVGATELVHQDITPVHHDGMRDVEFLPALEQGNRPPIIQNGRLELRVRDGDLTPELLSQVVNTATVAIALQAKSTALSTVLEAESKAFEAKSRAIRGMVVSVLAVALVWMVGRRQP
ncbi:hypothetical protein B0T25DRAFT_576262 [Lasiosphaeria hispida]|uniref:Uncharacterized protein n=1 Tax=Lasiosphaeria hispida TaxID=260671 RepID=A0AAJ0HW98_9PEZI|nr:hypothetical protein B0T25DRAFT_576262 [Lasiosphaeria hispida]